MGTEIEVLQPGLFSSIQDFGRTGFLKYGVPLSGAMDNFSAKMANLVLNNQPDSAVLEITQMGPKLKFHSSTKIALSGADLSAAINNIPIKVNIVYSIKEGDILSFGKPVLGMRTYLSVAGGFQTEMELGSRSWYDGITSYYRLEKGQKIPIHPVNNSIVYTYSSVKVSQKLLLKEEVDVFEGPEFYLLTKEETDSLFQNAFSIDKNNNRMAIQLKEELKNNLEPIITGPVLPGTVQLTPSGKLIVLMRDCQTTGGYPRVLQLSNQAMDVISQKSVGGKFRFKLQTLGNNSFV